MLANISPCWPAYLHVGRCISMLAGASPCWPVYVARSTSRVNRRRGYPGPIGPAGPAEHGLRGGFPLFEQCRRTRSAPRLAPPRGPGNDLLSWGTELGGARRIGAMPGFRWTPGATTVKITPSEWAGSQYATPEPYCPAARPARCFGMSADARAVAGVSRAARSLVLFVAALGIRARSD